MKKKVITVVFMMSFLLMAIMPLASAGLGIKWTQESILTTEKTKSCITYFIYNPYAGDTYASLSPSEEFGELIVSGESEVKFVPSGTTSSQAIPLTYCFKSPRIYERDCWIGDSLICETTCEEEMKVFEGEMIAKEVTVSDLGGASQGSATQTSITAPMRIRIQCVPKDRNYSFIYVVIASIAAILLAISLFNKKKKSSVKKKK